MITVEPLIGILLKPKSFLYVTLFYSHTILEHVFYDHDYTTFSIFYLKKWRRDFVKWKRGLVDNDLDLKFCCAVSQQCRTHSRRYVLCAEWELVLKFYAEYFVLRKSSC